MSQSSAKTLGKPRKGSKKPVDAKVNRIVVCNSSLESKPFPEWLELRLETTQT